jgi:hypothetical protein
MNWIETPESSNLSRFRYDESAQLLIVDFKNGTTYTYYDIPETLFQQMKSATSKGQFLAQNIKGTYRYARS